MAFSLSQPIVERFVMRPTTLLLDSGDGVNGLVSRVAIIASSSRAALPSILRVVNGANPQQRRAIAQGLAVAARVCKPADARQIALAVQGFPDSSFRDEFKARAAVDTDYRDQARAQIIEGSIPKRPEERLSSSGNMLFDPLNPRAIAPVAPVGKIRPIDQLAPIR